MRYLREGVGDDASLLVDDGNDVYDLTEADPFLDSFETLVRTARAAGETVNEIAQRRIAAAPRVAVPSDTTLAKPLTPDEVWACGVTYEISEAAREEESGMPEIYLDVYEATRPEVFFKGTDGHAVGPHDAVGIRGDSDWNVPEPELGIVLIDEEVVGYTIGNDMSSRSIEGKNPLYLPQAKVYDRACAIGPAVVPVESIGDPHDLEMSMTISRDGETTFEGTTSTGEMVRTCSELVEAYERHQAVPDVAVLLTGTSLVPDDEFTLHVDDRIRIRIEGIGTIENVVAEV